MKALFCAVSVSGLAGLLASSTTAPAVCAAPTVAQDLTVDPVHSFVSFRTKHMGLSMAVGTFSTILADQSTVVFDKDMTKSSITLVVDAASVSTGIAKRDEHLRNADFFSAKEFPEIVFESKKISGTEKAFEVAGELTFHGVTKPVTAKGHLVGKSESADGPQLGFTAELTFDLGDFGIEMVKKNPGAVGPEVAITVDLRCVGK
jgi:polyisoprenoid-binding protein YceI